MKSNKVFFKRNKIPGLSVWLWGPTFWNILHTVAFYSDSTTPQIYKEQDLLRFFEHLEALLPCPYCSESYGKLFRVTEKLVGDLQSVLQRRQLTKFVYTLHEQVSRKLLLQKWSTFIKDSKEKKALQDFDTDTVWQYLNGQPALSVVYKRQEFSANEPLQLDSVWILTLALLQRSTKALRQNILSYLLVLLPTLKASDFRASQFMAEKIKLGIESPESLFDSYRQWIEFQKGKKLRNDKFMHTLQYKLDTMLSTGCSSGTCK